MSAQPEALAIHLADRLTASIITGHDWPNTSDELLIVQAAEELRRLHTASEANRAAMREALEAMEPVSAYGRVGSRDVEQAALQSAITDLRQRLEGTT